MMLRRLFVLACLVFLGAGLFAGAGVFAQPAQPAAAQGPQPVNFGGPENVIPLKPGLAPYHAPGGPEADGSSWYMLPVMNNSVRPAIRVLLAGQPPSAALSFFPRSTRPAILAVASSESGVTVETATAYGRRAWRVIIPPVTTAALAIRVGSADTPPALSAWSEPALSSHNRQLAIFITAVGALIAAAMLITGGLAVLIGHSAPRWVAISLFLLLLSWLSSSAVFDGSIVLRVGGPYGLTAFFTNLALAAGARLANAIVPFRDVWPKYQAWFQRGIWALVVLGALAWIGLPGATLLSNVAVVLGGLAQMFVTIVGGQAFPLEMFPGYAVSSTFQDGIVNSYAPVLGEFALGFGGIALAFLITVVAVRVLRFLPQDDFAALKSED